MTENSVSEVRNSASALTHIEELRRTTMTLRSILCLHNAVVGLAVARTLPALVRFYAWFSQSRLAMAEKRGFGQGAGKFYGVLPAPKLSVPAMAASGFVLLACLAAPLLPVPDTACIAACAVELAAYFLYLSQVYCEAHVGARVTVLVPPFLLLFALAPAWHSESADEATVAAATGFTVRMLQLILTVAYCGAGVSKITSSIKAGRQWWDGSTMQAILLEGLYLSTPKTHSSSFGVPTPRSHALQQLFVRYPRLLLAPMSAVAVVFEAFAPAMLFVTSGTVARAFAALGVKFHYGIAVLQNVDFVSWWGAAYAPFIRPAGDAFVGRRHACGVRARAAVRGGIVPVRGGAHRGDGRLAVLPERRGVCRSPRSACSPAPRRSFRRWRRASGCGSRRSRTKRARSRTTPSVPLSPRARAGTRARQAAVPTRPRRPRPPANEVMWANAGAAANSPPKGLSPSFAPGSAPRQRATSIACCSLFATAREALADAPRVATSRARFVSSAERATHQDDDRRWGRTRSKGAVVCHGFAASDFYAPGAGDVVSSSPAVWWATFLFRSSVFSAQILPVFVFDKRGRGPGNTRRTRRDAPRPRLTAGFRS